MAKDHIDSKCGLCVHSQACMAWIQHGSTLYSDFSYSVEDCPDYASSADVVEVVRCGECQHSFKGPLEELMCKRKMLGIVRPEDFCSFGERRENDGRA